MWHQQFLKFLATSRDSRSAKHVSWTDQTFPPFVSDRDQTTTTDKLHSFELLTGMEGKAILSDLHGIEIIGSLPSRQIRISE